MSRVHRPSQTPREEVVAKLRAYAAANYGGDYRTAFDATDLDGDGRVSQAELIGLLNKAGVGNAWTRAAWARGVVAALDTSADGRVSWDEFRAAFT